MPEDPTRPHAGEVQGNQGGAAATPAPAHSPTRGLVEAGHRRLLRLPRGADKQPCPAGLPERYRNPLVVQPPAARPAGPNNVGEDEEDGRRVAPQASHSSPLAIS